MIELLASGTEVPKRRMSFDISCNDGLPVRRREFAHVIVFPLSEASSDLVTSSPNNEVPSPSPGCHAHCSSTECIPALRHPKFGPGIAPGPRIPTTGLALFRSAVVAEMPKKCQRRCSFPCPSSCQLLSFYIRQPGVRNCPQRKHCSIKPLSFFFRASEIKLVISI